MLEQALDDFRVMLPLLLHPLLQGFQWLYFGGWEQGEKFFFVEEMLGFG